MAVSARAIDAALADIVGRDHVSDDATIVAAASVDGAVPRWVVRPGTLAEVAVVVALAAEEKLGVVPRGSGSALGLGNPPARADLLLDLRRLDRVLEYNPDDLTATVETGVTAGILAERLAARRQFLPVDPRGWRTRTLGGLAATAASGPLRARYGTLRDLVLGVRFVQADGVVTWGGAKVVKSVTGYDIPKLMVGALGTLGVLGELTLRLHPAPETERTWLVRFAGAEGASAFLAAVLDSTVQPNRVHVLNGSAARALGLEARAPALAVCVGSVEAAVVAGGDALARLAAETGGEVARADELWTALDRAVPGETSLHVATVAARAVETVGAIEATVGPLGLDARVAGCAAVGTLDVDLDGAVTASAARIVEHLRAAVAPDGGSVVVRRGSRELRAAVDPWGPIPRGPLALMRRLKAQFDPGRVLNPGRFVGGL